MLRSLLLVAAASLACAAHAVAQPQTIGPPPASSSMVTPRPAASTPAAPLTEVTLVLGLDDLKTLDACVQELPHKAARPFIDRINKQLSEQQQKAAPAPK